MRYSLRTLLLVAVIGPSLLFGAGRLLHRVRSEWIAAGKRDQMVYRRGRYIILPSKEFKRSPNEVICEF